MHLALVGPTIEENLSVAHLAASLRRAGHEVSIVPFARDADHAVVAGRLAALAPEVVGLSMTFQVRARGFLDLIEDLRAEGYAGTVVAGGHFASVAAEEVLARAPGLDLVLTGEADVTIVAMAEALQGQGDLAAIPGAVLRRDGVFARGPRPEKPLDLDALPWAARDTAPTLLHLGQASAPLVASRGCRGSCTFCSIQTFGRLMRGPARRVRSAEDVVAEMDALSRERGVRVFIFHDDDFFDGDPAADLARVRAFGAAMRERALPPVALVVKARPDDIDDSVVEALVALGLVRVFLGVETDAPAGLRALGRRLASDANRKALGILRRRGVFVCSNLLLWEPDTTVADLHANLALLRDHPEMPFNFARTELYEGAPLTTRLAHQGRLRGDTLSRDYVVADPRAELAWRIFRVAMGERCYPLQGVVNAAMGLGYDAHLLLRFHPSPAHAALADRALGLVRRTAEATRERLEEVVALAEGADLGDTDAILAATLDLARAVRTEDAQLLVAMERAQAELEAAAERARLSAASPAGASRSAASRAVAGAAAAGLLATAGAARAAEPPPTTPTKPVTLVVYRNDGSWEQCRPPENARTRRFTLEATLAQTDSKARFDRFLLTDGAIEDLYVSPDGRRVHAVLEVGKGKGPQSLVAVFSGETGRLAEGAVFYAYGDGNATLGGDAKPAPECYQVCDMAAPPPDTLLVASGDVIFTRGAYDPSAGWAHNLRVRVGLRDRVKGELVGRPEVTCTAGRATLSAFGGGWHGPHPEGTPPKDIPPPMRLIHLLGYDPRPADGSGRLAGGAQSCTVSFKVREGGKERVVTGKLPVQIAEDGQVRLGLAAGSRTLQAADALPLPERYGTALRCLADDGATVVLELDSPGAALNGVTAIDWSVTGGSIAPLEGGWRAVWHPPEGAGPHVALCAVRSGPGDLQVASLRRG